MRKVLHLDMDAFYASVEQRDDPSLRGKPVVVAWKGARSVVCAASYEARRFGIRSAMPAIRAERLCPSAIFVPPDFDRYRAASQHIREIFHRHTDLVEPLSLDEAYLDVTSNKLGLASATAVAQAIRHAIVDETGLTASAGVAPNKFLAKIASDWNKPDGLHVIRPHQVLDFLTPLPVGRLPGVGKVMEARLAKLEITLVGQLRTLPTTMLEQQLGRWGLRLWQLSLGIDEQPVRPPQAPKQISAEDTFAEDLHLDQLWPTIQRLADKVWQASSRQPHLRARTIVLKLKTEQFVSLSRSLTPLTAPQSINELTQALELLLARIELPVQQRYRLVGVGLAGFRDTRDDTRQADLFV